MRNVLIFFLLLSQFHLMGQETSRLMLSGTGADNTREWQFYCSAGMNSGKWTTIQVPSCWEQQGFGAYNYGHDKFENRLNETGTYKYDFSVPANWRKDQVEIVFEGVMTDAQVKINGKLAGPVHQGAFYQFRYDITNLLRYGRTNQLEVFVKKHSDNVTVSRAEREADFWIFGGIFRPVYLESKPLSNIKRVAVDAKADGSFRADVYLSNLKGTSSVEVDITDASGAKQATFSSPILSEVTQILGKLSSPKTWNQEFPNLYTATFKLLDKNRKIIHQTSEKIGFRTIEIRAEDGVYLNGVRVKFKGVCRHTFQPKYGRTSSRAISEEVVNLIKDMNMNAVRMSHYPPDQHFLAVCDSLGLLVLDELTAWQKPCYDDVVGRKLLEEMIARDVNHPCVVLWDNGNEGGENNNLNDVFGQLDIQKREVLHPWQDYLKTNTLHYIDYNYLALDGYSKRKIYFPTEFLHGLYDGGLGAGLDDYWSKMWSEPLAAGGFLWVFADEAVERTDRNGALDTDGNHAPDGILGPYHQKEGSFYTIKEIWSPLYFEKRYITPEFNGVFRIENRYFFTDLKECKLTAEWVNFSAPANPVSEKVIFSEPLNPALAPGQKGTLELKLPKEWRSIDQLRITMLDRYGRHLNTWTWPIKSPEQKMAELIVNTPKGTVEYANQGDVIDVKTGNLSLSFSKQNGVILGVKRGGQEIPLTNGPLFVSGSAKIKEVSVSRDGENCLILAKYGNRDQVRWCVYPSGLVELTVSYEPENMAQFAGVTFSYPEEAVAGMKWLGKGPYRVYKNRIKGANFGLWEKAYNNTVTGESEYVYPEFKGYHAEVYWAKIEGKNKVPDFTVYVASKDIFLRMLTPVNSKKSGKEKMDYPIGDLSFLHAINAIGTKFSPASSAGPQSIPSPYNRDKMHGEKMTIKLIFDFINK